MIDPRKQVDREIDNLEQQLANGDISNAEFNRELREIERDYSAQAEESARDAYDRELGCW